MFFVQYNWEKRTNIHMINSVERMMKLDGAVKLCYKIMRLEQVMKTKTREPEFCCIFNILMFAHRNWRTVGLLY